jgi:hypothetical protein
VGSVGTVGTVGMVGTVVRGRVRLEGKLAPPVCVALPSVPSGMAVMQAVWGEVRTGAERSRCERYIVRGGGYRYWIR